MLRLSSFNICKKQMQMFCQTVLCQCPLLHSGLLGRLHQEKRNAHWLNRIIRKAGSLVGAELESVETVVDKSTHTSYLLHADFSQQRRNHTAM